VIPARKRRPMITGVPEHHRTWRNPGFYQVQHVNEAHPIDLNDLAEQVTPDSITEERSRRAGRKIDTLFPAEGPLRRQLYVKHLKFFAGGSVHRERLFQAGNRCGKTEAGCYEDTLHLTGEYPDWWVGRRFTTPISAWVASLTQSLTRDILQEKLLGPWGHFGTGMIPRERILGWTKKSGTANAVDTVRIASAHGGESLLGFKSYAEGPGNFQGTSQHLIHFDEEPSMAVYTEANMRTMIVPGAAEGGLMMVTFTPLLGFTEVIQAFMDAASENTE
jgi:phage terminase large subunit-like protein